MRWIFAAVLLGGIISAEEAVASCQSGTVEVRDGFQTGQSWLAWPAEKQRAYIQGLVSGLFVSVFLRVPVDCMSLAYGCVEGMNDEQMAAIVRKHLNERPEIWHHPV